MPVALCFNGREADTIVSDGIFRSQLPGTAIELLPVRS